MRVAIDEQIFAIQPVGGISRMFSEVARQFVLGNPADVELAAFRTPIVNRYVLEDDALRSGLRARAARNPWTALAAYFGNLSRPQLSDVTHSTFYLPQGLDGRHSGKRIVTIHDMIPELMPETRRRLDLVTLKQRYVRSADHVICVSESTKQDLLKVYGLIDVPIHVIHHGVSSHFRPGVKREDFLPAKYVLFVGHRHQYKDAEVLFRAFALIAKNDPEIQLLCVGGNGLSRAESSLLKELGVRSRVSQRFLPDELMASAYANAEVFVFPSHFEGFGLPALEAMASGVPAILARATSLPEIGGDAAMYFEPGAVGDLADCLRRVLEDDSFRESLVTKGLDRAQEFTWARAAERTAAVYRDALS